MNSRPSAPRSPGLYLLMAFLGLSLASCKSGNTPPAPSLQSSQERIPVSGTLVSEGLPINHATLFFKGLEGQKDSEVITRANGSFEHRLRPGRYLLTSQPTGYCPVSGEITLPRNPDGPVPLRIELSRISFYHCSPGTILLAGKDIDQKGAPLTKLGLLSGIIDETVSGTPVAPNGEKTTFFLTEEGSKGKTIEIPLDNTGRFIAPPLSPGRYVLDLALPGLCPVHQTLEIPPGPAFLNLSLSKHQTGTPCPAPRATIILPGS